MAWFLRDMLNQLQEFIGKPYPSDPLSSHAEAAGEINMLIEDLTAAVTVYSNQEPSHPALIIIDDYDQIPSQPRALFENQILSNIIRLPTNNIVVLSSQHELEFNNRLDIFERSESFPLEGASINDIKLALPEEYRDIAGRIQKWTKGMPRLVEFLINQSVEMHIVSEQAFDNQIGSLINRQYRDRLWAVSFKQEAQKENERIMVTEKCLDPLSLLRRFDVSILRELLPNLPELSDFFRNKPQKDYLNLIRDLGSRIHWLPDGGGYQLDLMLKEMLYAYVRQYEPSYFRQVNQLMVEICERLLERRYHLNHFIELIYHHWELARLKGLSDDGELAKHMEQVLTTQTEKYVRTYPNDNPVPVDIIDSLKQSLQLDKDLAHYLSPTVIKAIDSRAAEDNR